MKSVEIVTDSTCDLPQETIKNFGIGVVPTTVVIGDTPHLDYVEISPEEFLTNLHNPSSVPISTAASSPLEYKKTWEKCNPTMPILSIHVAGGLSGIFNTAVGATKEAPELNITPFDSGTVSLGLGFMVLEAVRLSEKGEDINTIVSHLEKMKTQTHVFASLATLEFVKRGGRINHLTHTIGSILGIHPILHIAQNAITTSRIVRTMKASLNTLAETVKKLGELEYIGVLFVDTPQKAYEIRDNLSVHSANAIMVSQIGPALSVHTGPGAIGIAAVQKQQHTLP